MSTEEPMEELAIPAQTGAQATLAPTVAPTEAEQSTLS